MSPVNDYQHLVYSLVAARAASDECSLLLAVFLPSERFHSQLNNRLSFPPIL